MEKQIISIFTRTPLHVGAGNSVGAVDSPVMRERHTRIPIIPGSSLKGVLADLWNDEKCERTQEGKKLFGEDDARNASDAKAGQLLVGEARVLAFPVRSAKGSFAWISCPLALRRLERDAELMLNVAQFDDLTEDRCAAVSDAVTLSGGRVVLEEYQFSCQQKDLGVIAENLAALSADPVWKEIGKRLVVVNDEMFSYFVEQACEVVSRIRVNDATGTVDAGGLFNQEQVPSETMFYAVLGAETKRAASEVLDQVRKKLASVGNVLQIGGDETIGLGYCTVTLN